MTNAKAGESQMAFPFTSGTTSKAKPKLCQDSPFWNRIGELGKQVGLVWGGDFHGFKDKPNFEFHPNLTLAQANQRRESNQNFLA